VRVVNINYFIAGALVRFLFMSCEESFHLLIRSLKIQHLYKISRQCNEFYSLESVLFKISAKGKEEILELVIYSNIFISYHSFYPSSLSIGLSLFYRGTALLVG